MKKLLFVGMCLAVSACMPVQPPASLAEKYARVAASGDLAFEKCGQFMMGGFDSAREMKLVRDQNIELARKEGADAALFEKAKTDVATAYNNTVIFSNPQQACNALVTEIAREG